MSSVDVRETFCTQFINNIKYLIMRIRNTFLSLKTNINLILLKNSVRTAR